MRVRVGVRVRVMVRITVRVRVRVRAGFRDKKAHGGSMWLGEGQG